MPHPRHESVRQMLLSRLQTLDSVWADLPVMLLSWQLCGAEGTKTAPRRRRIRLGWPAKVDEVISESFPV